MGTRANFCTENVSFSYKHIKQIFPPKNGGYDAHIKPNVMQYESYNMLKQWFSTLFPFKMGTKNIYDKN